MGMQNIVAILMRNLNERVRVLQIVSGSVGIDGTEEALSWAYMVNNEYCISLLKEGYIFLIELSNNGGVYFCRRQVRAKFISTQNDDRLYFKLSFFAVNKHLNTYKGLKIAAL